MALADRGWRLGLFLPLTHALSVTARLLTTALLALVACPIPFGRKPPRPSPRRLATGFATVPRERMNRRKPLLAPFQEADSRTAMGRDLPPRRRAIMLDIDQGSANSRRSSPGSGDSPPLRDAFDWSPPVRVPSLQPNHPAAVVPLFPAAVAHLAPISPRFIRARLGPLSPRKWPPVSPRLTHLGG